MSQKLSHTYSTHFRITVSREKLSCFSRWMSEFFEHISICTSKVTHSSEETISTHFLERQLFCCKRKRILLIKKAKKMKESDRNQGKTSMNGQTFTQWKALWCWNLLKSPFICISPHLREMRRFITDNLSTRWLCNKTSLPINTAECSDKDIIAQGPEYLCPTGIL